MRIQPGYEQARSSMGDGYTYLARPSRSLSFESTTKMTPFAFW